MERVSKACAMRHYKDDDGLIYITVAGLQPGKPSGCEFPLTSDMPRTEYHFNYICDLIRRQAGKETALTFWIDKGEQ